ncbi:hypothetical protein DPMN_085963 [Dreissena polymorpha]|uniref:Uncharacterized protein n=1 Tax=Dreissena polymorpha TaxID=45954 RepID=A0A9D3YDA7_DREPO|nr:hypothetical protein DPMN_085963 [Dreissena polymorpha]
MKKIARQRPTRLITGPCIYQFEVSRCRNEEFIVKGNFGWAWSMWARAPQVNRCRNEEVIVNGTFGWAWSMWTRRPRVVEIDRIVIRDIQYQFEVNRCRNEEVIIKGSFGSAWSMWAGRPGLVMGPCIYQFEVNECKNEEVNFQCSKSGQDGRTDRQTYGGDNHNIPTLFKKLGDKNM